MNDAIKWSREQYTDSLGNEYCTWIDKANDTWGLPFIVYNFTTREFSIWKGAENNIEPEDQEYVCVHWDSGSPTRFEKHIFITVSGPYDSILAAKAALRVIYSSLNKA
jgi:hypothetical protein